MAFLLLPIMATFLFGIVCLVYGIQEPTGDLLLVGVFFLIVTLTLFFAWGKEMNRHRFSAKNLTLLAFALLCMNKEPHY